jgi:NTP pyrophosphatase (non-canonical NTP hydrolase)
MIFSEYQAGVIATWNQEPSRREQILNATLGLAGEAGETADAVLQI